MDTKEKLLKAFEQFRPHINGHKTAIDLFFEGIKEVEDLREQVKNCSIPDVSDSLKNILKTVKKKSKNKSWMGANVHSSAFEEGKKCVLNILEDIVKNYH